MWYTIQILVGKEQRIKCIIENMISHKFFEDCKVIYSETKRKYMGGWHTEKKIAFPGYLFIISDQIEALVLELNKIPELKKALTTKEVISPISEMEEQVLNRLIGEDGVVGMSRGYKKGDWVVVTDGCLKGMESFIQKVDRHKKKAWIGVKLLGRTRVLECGLEVLGSEGA